MKTRLLSCVAALFALALPALGADDARWWPTQALPKGVVQVAKKSSDAGKLPVRMMLQSISGLAAKSVNEGSGDEMVWIPSKYVDIEDFYARFMKDHPQVQPRGTFGPWELVDRFAKKGVIKGYILYRADDSDRPLEEHRPNMECSVNVATSLAGVLDGILIDESLESTAKKHGLPLLIDVRDKTQQWCFDTYKNKFTRKMLCTQDPKKATSRDLAIAHKTFALFGYDAPAQEAMEWVEPLSPILGWNGGDEYKTTRMSSVYGLFQTCTDWCENLPLLMAGSDKAPPLKVKRFDPRTIDWKDNRSAVSFVCSDGDNVQWYETSFFRHVGNYWDSPDRGKMPFGWSCPFTHLTQLLPQGIEYALSTQTPNDWFIEWGGGYYYPELFAAKRENRWALLAEHARRTWELMKLNNTRIIGFNIHDLDDRDSIKAMETFAAQTDGLLAIMVFKYAPYDGGAGRRFWVKDRNGIDIPVVTARYSIWEHYNKTERSGTPARVAKRIAESVKETPADDLPRYDWVIVHVWSYFQNTPGSDEDAEDMRQGDDYAPDHGGKRGYSPAWWCAQRLPKNIRTIGPEELLWRIRMEHNQQQTKELIEKFKP